MIQMIHRSVLRVLTNKLIKISWKWSRTGRKITEKAFSVERKKNYKRPAESLTPSNQNLKKWRVAQDFYMLLYVAIVYF